ncbi:nose resistant to fluoxetine protein 6-like isoform X4 [Dermacentor variabilis]|uniref:nose resistant to fluoxetine protein 6-like isoform X4 n=1 Tax=Dermacentor variabilis TaxID=34621 RepID=UPI003F5C7BC3
MARESIHVSVWFLLFLLNSQVTQAFEIFDGVIGARRREVVRMKASQWKPFLQRLAYSLHKNPEVNATCLENMRLFVDAMMRQDDAGLELLDSLGSLPSGILRGSLTDEASYAGCFSANVTDINGNFVSRKFCDVVVYHRAAIPNFPVLQNQQTPAKIFVFTQSLVKIGVCIPSSCTDENFAVIVNDALSKWNLASIVALCDYNEPPEETPVLIIFFLGIFAATVAAATLVDVLNPAKPTTRDDQCVVGNTGPGKFFVVRFRTLSLMCTMREMFRFDTSNDDRLDIFNGLRALAMVWTIALHTHLYIDEIALGNIDEVFRKSRTLPRQLIVNATMSVSVFLTISGFMQWKTVWNRSNNEKSRNGWLAVVIHRYLRTGSTWPVLIVMGLAMLVSYVENYTMQYPAGHLFFVPLTSHSGGEHVYYMPHSHIPSYCLGILAGFWCTTKAPRRLPRHKVAFLWVTSLCGICVAQFGSVLWTGHKQPARVITALYAATHRGLFSAGIAWIIYACLADRAGFLGSLLAWPGWAPMSRLSFSTYMIHDIMIQYQWTTFTSRVDGGYYFMAILTAGNCVASLVAAFMLHALFEKPLALIAALLEEHFLPRRRPVSNGLAIETGKDEDVTGGFTTNDDGDHIKLL